MSLTRMREISDRLGERRERPYRDRFDRRERPQRNYTTNDRDYDRPSRLTRPNRGRDRTLNDDSISESLDDRLPRRGNLRGSRGMQRPTTDRVDLRERRDISERNLNRGRGLRGRGSRGMPRGRGAYEMGLMRRGPLTRPEGMRMPPIPKLVDVPLSMFPVPLPYYVPKDGIC